MDHPSFSHEQQLPSLKVTRDFLKDLEAYLIKRLVETSLLVESETSSAITVRIQDSLGTETLGSIQKMQMSRFADSTSSVEVEAELPFRQDGTRLRIRLSFTRSRLFTTLAITATMPAARDTVLGLRDGLLRMLEPARTWHWLGHPKNYVWGVLFATGSVIGYHLFRSNGLGPRDPYLLLAFASVWLYLFVAGRLLPYTIFDSRSLDRADKIWNWLIGGIATFLIFGTVLTYLRRPALGF
jgi:hypothetical protein